jgi:hypothetical protein
MAEGQFQYTTSMLETPTAVKNPVLDNVVHCLATFWLQTNYLLDI